MAVTTYKLPMTEDHADLRVRTSPTWSGAVTTSSILVPGLRRAADVTAFEAADRAVEPLGSLTGAPAAGDLLLPLDHPQSPVAHVVIERNVEIMGEPQPLDTETGVLLVADDDDLAVAVVNVLSATRSSAVRLSGGRARPRL